MRSAERASLNSEWARLALHSVLPETAAAAFRVCASKSVLRGEGKYLMSESSEETPLAIAAL